MAKIYDLVQTIRNAVYGKDVRESIAQSIEEINKDVMTSGILASEARDMATSADNTANQANINSIRAENAADNAVTTAAQLGNQAITTATNLGNQANETADLANQYAQDADNLAKSANTTSGLALDISKASDKKSDNAVSIATDAKNYATSVVANEDTRRVNEGVRLSNEDIRKNNEYARQTDEDVRKANENQRILNEQNRNDVFSVLKTESTNATNYTIARANDALESATNANTAATDSRETAANYIDVVEKTKKIYKPSVTTYANILTTYPTPDIGWTVQARDSHIEYRWDGIEWVDIGVTDQFEGYNVHVGPTPPTNVNLLWVKTEAGESRLARILPSKTEPVDKNVIWWKID